MKAVDIFFPKRLLVQSKRHPWIDNEVIKYSSKKATVTTGVFEY